MNTIGGYPIQSAFQVGKAQMTSIAVDHDGDQDTAAKQTQAAEAQETCATPPRALDIIA